mmetsp:Transcript_39003/g.79827  ORF Transcript_39003/g.79827 Transcript_39003/m.79827 type:complete len:940 (-) Transcript_39003:378-3197(-)|eukprot:CAMPEP_0178682154 /NCGR_PEP_ID=MMETSP0699-20121125/1619_1 /TAXON_ID=265572 /ORGANISM="Extubocellulus spinifer, Strain CCMP396" /LENGTH=939 /DNA_ID=CAMNT_0020326663 /DNA_START=7273 /DNA_END=10092 /DNA_ORIENTATION=-
MTTGDTTSTDASSNPPTAATAASASPSASSSARSPQPDRDAFLRRLEEQQQRREQERRQQQAGADETKDPGIDTTGSSSARTTTEEAASTAATGSYAPTSPASIAAAAAAAAARTAAAKARTSSNSNPSPRSRPSGIPPPRASSSPSPPSSKTVMPPSSSPSSSSPTDTMAQRPPEEPILRDEEDERAVLSYLSECGISLTADIGLFAPGGIPTADGIEEMFDSASLEALLDLSKSSMRSVDVVNVGGRGGGDNDDDGGEEKAERSFEELRLEDYTETPALANFVPRTTGPSASVSAASASAASASASASASAGILRNVGGIDSIDGARLKGKGQGIDKDDKDHDYGGGEGEGEDNASTVPPLREVRGADVAAPAAAAAAADDSRAYSREVSELSTPPSLVAGGGSTGGGVGFVGGPPATAATAAATVRTDATTAGSTGLGFRSAGAAAASANTTEDEEDVDLSALEPWQRALFRKIDEQTRLVRAVEVRVDALSEMMRLQQQQGPGRMPPPIPGVWPQQQPFHFPQQQQQAQQHHGDTFAPPSGANGNDQDEVARLMELPQDRDDAVRMLRGMPPAPGQTAAPGEQQQQPQQQQQPLQQQQPHQYFFFLSILERVIEGVVTILTAPYALGLRVTSYLTMLRPVRLVRHVYNEADRRGVLRRFDLSLLFKFIFVSAILAGRTGRGSRRRGGKVSTGVDGMPSLSGLWEAHRLTILLSATVFALLVQTGFVKLIWDVIIKEDAIGMIWRDEDLREQGGADRTEAAAADGANVRPAERDRLDGDEGADAAGGGNAAAGQEANEALAAAAAAGGGGGGQQQPANVADVGARGAPARRPAPPPPRRPAAPQQRGFFGGGIQPVAADGGFSAIGFIVDIVYLLGSFVFSLLPAWNPERIRDPAPPEPAPDAEAAGNEGDDGNDGDGDVDDQRHGANPPELERAP